MESLLFAAEAPLFNYTYRERASAMIEPHSHNSFELLFVLQGRGGSKIRHRAL